MISARTTAGHRSSTARPRGENVEILRGRRWWRSSSPPPRPARLRVHEGASALVPPRRPEDVDLRPLGVAEGAPPAPTTRLEAPHHNWYVYRDLAEDVSTLEVLDDRGSVRFDETGMEMTRRGVERYRSRGNEFDSLRAEAEWQTALRRGDWSVRTVTRTLLTSDAEAFHVHATLDAYEGERRFHCRTWNRTIPRRLL